jgi:hypothetical protein
MADGESWLTADPEVSRTWFTPRRRDRFCRPPALPGTDRSEGGTTERKEGGTTERKEGGTTERREARRA